MKKLNRKLILEFLDDETGELTLDKKDLEEPIQEPIEVEINQEENNLSEGEKKNFIISLLTDLSGKVFDLFSYLTPYFTLEVQDKDSEFNHLSEENKALLSSIYEDVSLMVGKITQGLKDNTAENIQNAIDDGQTQAQETITPESTLEEDLKSDKEKLWDDLTANVDMGDYFDEMKEHEDEEEERFFKDPKKALQDWKHYYSENPEMLGKIKAFEDKYFKE